MLRVPLVALSPGMWRSPDVLQQALGLIVIDGFLLCSRGDLSGGHATLVGPGDLLDPRPAAEGRATWAVVLSGQAAVVDARLLVAARRWPLLMRVFTQLLFDATEEHGTRAGMLALPSVDRRLLALLDHDADRWGRATLAGRVLDLPLTHEALGRLVGARRPTVSLALARLHERRALSRDQRGRWVLPFVAEDQRRVRA